MNFDGYSLAALGLALLFVLVLAVFSFHFLRRDRNIARTKVGLFVERERFDGEVETTTWPERDD